MALQRGLAVDIDRRADGCGDMLKRDGLAMQDAVAQLKMVHLGPELGKPEATGPPNGSAEEPGRRTWRMLASLVAGSTFSATEPALDGLLAALEAVEGCEAAAARASAT